MSVDVDTAYKEGLEDGIRRYAWWKEGVQYVGSCGKTLEKALQEVEEEFRPMTGEADKG